MEAPRVSDASTVAIIGAGPIGLASAARLVVEGIPFTIFERGEEIASSVRRWGHVRLFTPWRYLIDDAARELLLEDGWVEPDPEGVPNGYALVSRYLEPLASLPSIAPHLKRSNRVTALSRRGVDRLGTDGRHDTPFLIRHTDVDGRERQTLARAVIDASGTYDTPNPLGSSGVAAIGEDGLRDRLFYGIPDALGAHRARFEGKRVGVVGSGHSAFNALLDLHGLGDAGTEITWFLRSRDKGALFGGEDADALSERGQLGRRMRLLAESGRLTVLQGFRTAAIKEAPDGLVLLAEDGRSSGVLDEVIVTTGFRPDYSFARELRLDLDPTVEAPRPLAPLIDPNVHSCGTVPPHGYDELAHPEDGYYAVGMKSYGRAPTFLLVTGYEQTRSVVKALAGDLESAAEVMLDVPATGVCSSDPYERQASEEEACCGGLMRA